MAYIKPNKKGIKIVSNKSWRLVHDGISVMILAEQDSKLLVGVGTKVFVTETKEECEAEIERLNLKVPDYLKQEITNK